MYVKRASGVSDTGMECAESVSQGSSQLMTDVFLVHAQKMHFHHNKVHMIIHDALWTYKHAHTLYR